MAAQKKFVGWMYKQLGVMFDVYDGPLREVLDQSALNLGDDTRDDFQNLILQFLLPCKIPSVMWLRLSRQVYHNLTTVKTTIQHWAPPPPKNVIKATEKKKDPQKIKANKSAADRTNCCVM